VKLIAGFALKKTNNFNALKRKYFKVEYDIRIASALLYCCANVFEAVNFASFMRINCGGGDLREKIISIFTLENTQMCD